MKRFTKIIIASVASLATLMGVAAWAGHGWGHGGRGDYMIHRMEKKLDLNEDQLSKLRAIQAYVKEQRSAMPSRMDQLANVKDMLSQPQLDQGKTLSMINERLQQMQSKAPDFVERVATFSDSLSPEQRQKMTEMMDHFSKKMRRHHKNES